MELSRSENGLDRFLNQVFNRIARLKLCVITWAFWKICSLTTLVAMFSFKLIFYATESNRNGCSTDGWTSELRRFY